MLAAQGIDRGIVYLYDSETGMRAKALNVGTADLKELAFSPNGDQLISVQNDTIGVWNLRTSTRVLEIAADLQLGEQPYRRIKITWQPGLAMTGQTPL
jgi:WD40 repeat protein